MRNLLLHLLLKALLGHRRTKPHLGGCQCISTRFKPVKIRIRGGGAVGRNTISYAHLGIADNDQDLTSEQPQLPSISTNISRSFCPHQISPFHWIQLVRCIKLRAHRAATERPQQNHWRTTICSGAPASFIHFQPSYKAII